MQNSKGTSLKEQPARDGDVGGSYDKHLASKVELTLSFDSDGPNDSYPRFTSPPMQVEANVGGVQLLVGGGSNAIAVYDGNFLEQQKDNVLEGGEDVCECPKTVPTKEGEVEASKDNVVEDEKVAHVAYKDAMEAPLNVDVAKEISISSKMADNAILVGQDMALKDVPLAVDLALKEVPVAMDLVTGAPSRKARKCAKTPSQVCTSTDIFPSASIKVNPSKSVQFFSPIDVSLYLQFIVMFNMWSVCM